MKVLIFISLASFLFACKEGPVKKENNDLTATKKPPYGIWTDGTGPNASFKLTPNEYFIPDQEASMSSFKYKLINDSLYIYFDGFTSKSKILKSTNDSLILDESGEKTIYTRFID